ncbi:MAG: L,D-transpeptidase [Leptolyngbyaceae cyanobacterium]
MTKGRSLIFDRFEFGRLSHQGSRLGLLFIAGWCLRSAPAIAIAQPLNLPQPQALVSTAPQVIEDPTLFLPVPSERISRLVLKLSERRLYAYSGEQVVASYPVAIGREGWQTPTGEFAIFQQVQNPAWEHPLTGEVVPPGPENPLGVRWIGFWSDGVNAIGFHGTPDEHLIGQAVSHGCVRMRNADVIELYDRVQLGTQVLVQP